MEVTHRPSKTRQPGEPVDKLYMENTLLRVAGALFCHDPMRASTRIGKIELNRGTTDKHIVIQWKFQCKQIGIAATDAEHDQRAGVAEHRTRHSRQRFARPKEVIEERWKK
jgi:hypothetical protein